MSKAIEMLREGHAGPIWNLSDAVAERLEALGRPPERGEIPEADGVAEAKRVEDLVRGGEGKRVEFKATLRCDLATKGASKEVQKMVAKTVAAFLNTEGGSLIIGVRDDGVALGIEDDLRLLKKGTQDAFEVALRNVLREYLPEEVGTVVDVSFPKVDEKTVALVKCDAHRAPVYFSEGKDETFFVRSGNTTQTLGVRATADYIAGEKAKGRWA